jgi:tetratricopeptide (TPR) repeat protein
MFWLLVIGGIVTLVIVLGKISSAKERKNAPVRLAEAKRTTNEQEAFKLLAEALGDPAGVYTGDDARVMQEIIELAEALCKRRDLNIFEITAQLKASVGSGAPVKDSGKALRKFLERAAKEPNNLYGHLSAVTTPFFQADLEDRGPRRLGELSSEEQQLVSQLGRSLMFGGDEKAKAILAQYLPSARGAFEVDLLMQRGAYHFMQKDFEAAASDYERCVELEPESLTHRINLIEAYFRLGRSDEARRIATSATQAARTSKERAHINQVQARLTV